MFDGVPVVTTKDLEEGIEEIFSATPPPMSETNAEVATGKRYGSVLVHATCPRCGIVSEISVSLFATLTVDPDGSELKVSAKSKARPHTCGQLPLELNGEKIDGEQTAFDLDGIIGPTTQELVLTAMEEPEDVRAAVDAGDEPCGAKVDLPPHSEEQADLFAPATWAALNATDKMALECVRAIDHPDDHYDDGIGWRYETVPVPQGVEDNENAQVDQDNEEVR
jgi:hypothetical protein